MHKLLILMCLVPLVGWSQNANTKSEEYYLGFPFVEGIYLNMGEFKDNNPSFQNTVEKRGSDLYLMDDSTNKMVVVNPDKIWGYSQAGNIYIAYNDAYWRLINIGRLSHFSAIYISSFQTVDQFGFPEERHSKQLEHLFLDFESGNIKRLTYNNLESYFKEEPMQYDAFKKLKRKSQRDLILALRAYNRLHPVYFPVRQ